MIGKNLLGSRRGRLCSFGILYISEGIPLGFAAVAMAAYMRRQGLDVAQIGAFVGTFYLPWAFKWAWAPVVDLIRLERFGGRRAWILLCQSLMILTLCAVALVDYEKHFHWLLAIVLVHNFFSSTQDVAIDSLAVSVLPEDERGTANGFMFGGAYLGQGLGGGGAMFVSEYWGFDASFIFTSLLLILIFSFVTLFIRDPDAVGGAMQRVTGLWSRFSATLQHFVRELGIGFFRSGPGPIAGVCFALLPIGAMALGGAISSALQVDLGMSDADIAELNIYSTVLAGIGCVVGGWAADKFGQRKMLAVWYLFTILPTLYLAVQLSGEQGMAGVSIRTYFVVAIIYNFFTGMHYGTGAAVFMGLTNPLVAATQFTGFMSLKNLTISYTQVWQGAVAEQFSYSAVLYLDAVLVLVPLLALPWMRPSTSAKKLREAEPIAPIPEMS